MNATRFKEYATNVLKHIVAHTHAYLLACFQLICRSFVSTSEGEIRNLARIGKGREAMTLIVGCAGFPFYSITVE